MDTGHKHKPKKPFRLANKWAFVDEVAQINQPRGKPKTTERW